MYRIGLFIERHWHYGRRACEGIAAFARGRGDWSAEFPDWSALAKPHALAAYDGIIARVWNRDAVEALAAAGKPVVDVYCGEAGTPFVSVDQNARLVGQLAARHFIEHRFTNFAFCGYARQRYSTTRREAFVRALKLNRYECHVFEDANFSPDDFGRQIIRRGDFGFGMSEKRLVRWIRSLPKPVAVFCAHDLVAWHLLRICKALGHRVPEDVALLGVDDDALLCDFSSPALSSIDPNPFGIGYAAAESLAKWMDRPSVRPPDRFPAPVGLVERASTQTYPLNPAWLSDALVYIRRNVARNTTAADVFRHLGLSHTVVERAFRETLKSTVQREIAAVRVEEAKRLLEKTDQPIGVVAARAGFMSKSYFTAAFAAATGKTPLVWRRARSV